MRLDDNLNSTESLSEISSICAVNEDLIRSICGRHLGSGSFRSVYVYNLDPRFVVKLELLNTNCNQTEYELWDQIKELKAGLAWVKDWFAPIKWISPNGRVMIMKRTFEKENKELPNKVPAFMSDVKLNNFGWIGNKFVCHDYGFLYGFMNYSNKMKKINWYE